MDLQVLIKQYLSYCEVERGLRKRTIDNYRNGLERLASFLKSRELTLDSSKDYFNSLRVKGWQLESISTEIAYVQRFAHFLHKFGYTEKNWARKLERPKLKKKPYDLVPAEIAFEIIKAGSEPGKYDHILHRKSKAEHRLCLFFILFTGIRSFEACGIRIKDLRLEKNEFLIREGKGGEWRLTQIPPVPWLIEELSRREKEREPEDKLFIVNGNKLQQTMASGCLKLGIKKHIRVHTLRHIFANDLSEAGASIQDIANALGHKSIETTWRNYMHLNITHQKEVVRNKHSLVKKYRTNEEKVRDFIHAVQDYGTVTKSEVKDNEVTVTVKL